MIPAQNEPAKSQKPRFQIYRDLFCETHATLISRIEKERILELADTFESIMREKLPGLHFKSGSVRDQSLAGALILSLASDPKSLQQDWEKTAINVSAQGIEIFARKAKKLDWTPAIAQKIAELTESPLYGWIDTLMLGRAVMRFVEKCSEPWTKVGSRNLIDVTADEFPDISGNISTISKLLDPASVPKLKEVADCAVIALPSGLVLIQRDGASELFFPWSAEFKAQLATSIEEWKAGVGGEKLSRGAKEAADSMVLQAVNLALNKVLPDCTEQNPLLVDKLKLELEKRYGVQINLLHFTSRVHDHPGPLTLEELKVIERYLAYTRHTLPQCLKIISKVAAGDEDRKISGGNVGIVLQSIVGRAINPVSDGTNFNTRGLFLTGFELEAMKQDFGRWAPIRFFIDAHKFFYNIPEDLREILVQRAEPEARRLVAARQMFFHDKADDAAISVASRRLAQISFAKLSVEYQRAINESRVPNIPQDMLEIMSKVFIWERKALPETEAIDADN